MLPFFTALPLQGRPAWERGYQCLIVTASDSFHTASDSFHIACPVVVTPLQLLAGAVTVAALNFMLQQFYLQIHEFILVHSLL